MAANGSYFKLYTLWLWIQSLTECNSGWSRLTVDPERHPRYDDDQVARQVDLQQVISNLSLQPERYVQYHS